MSVMTPPGLAIELDENRFGLRRDRALEGGDVVGIRPHDVPAEILEGVIELVDRAAIELLRRDELVARRHQVVHDEHLRGVAGCDGEAGGAALERGHALLEHGVGRIADAGIDVSERLQPEQGRRVVDVVEHEGCRLINRRRARAGRGVGLRSGMDRKGRETGRAFGHRDILNLGYRKAGRCWFIGRVWRVKAEGGRDGPFTLTGHRCREKQKRTAFYSARPTRNSVLQNPL